MIAQRWGLPGSGPNPPELLRAYLEEKHFTPGAGQFEQIVVAAPLVDDLLPLPLAARSTVTSRQPPGCAGRTTVTVQPLALPASAPAGSVTTAEDSCATHLLNCSQTVTAVLPASG